MSFLQLQRVTRRFDNGSEGLSDVSLDIEQGSMVFLTGHSGAGKSTLLKLLIGAQMPTSGRVVVDGSDIAQLGPGALPWYRRQLGIVLQDHNLLNDRTVFDNVALPLRVTHLAAKEIARRVRGAAGVGRARSLAVRLLDPGAVCRAPPPCPTRPP